jgi:hypothetical protein
MNSLIYSRHMQMKLFWQRILFEECNYWKTPAITPDDAIGENRHPLTRVRGDHYVLLMSHIHCFQGLQETAAR